MLGVTVTNSNKESVISMATFVKCIYKKMTEGRGRPSRFALFDDGTTMHYKAYELQYGKLPETETPIETVIKTEIQSETSIQNNTVKTLIHSIDRTKKTAIFTALPENGIKYKTIYGSPIVKIEYLVDYGRGFEDVIAVLKRADGRIYKNHLKIVDITPKPEIVEV